MLGIKKLGVLPVLATASETLRKPASPLPRRSVMIASDDNICPVCLNRRRRQQNTRTVGWVGGIRKSWRNSPGLRAMSYREDRRHLGLAGGTEARDDRRGLCLVGDPHPGLKQGRKPRVCGPAAPPPMRQRRETGWVLRSKAQGTCRKSGGGEPLSAWRGVTAEAAHPVCGLGVHEGVK